VQRLLRSARVQRAGAGPGALDDSIAGAIQSKRGTGQGLDSSVRREMEPALGSDFSDVRIHTDSEADALNRSVRAEAFTTGTDIFFRQGNYSPGSTEGRKLLAHELTHVVQQRGAPPAQSLTVSSPDDASERQASAVADHLGGAPAGAAASVARQAEEEEEVATSPIARQEATEEEEEVATSPIARQEAVEEEEEVATSVARESAPEEEQEMPA
jgi:hypothetical protein